MLYLVPGTPTLAVCRCADPSELGLHYSSRLGRGGEEWQEEEDGEEDTVLLAEVRAAEEEEVEELVARLEGRGVHRTHYIRSRLAMR